MGNSYWEYKKQNFKASGLTVYAGYFLGDFQGYYHKKKNYRLIEKRTVKGLERNEKFIGYGMQIFHRGMSSWEDFKTYHKNFVNEIV